MSLSDDRPLSPAEHRLLGDTFEVARGDYVGPGSDAFIVMSLVGLGLMACQIMGEPDDDAWVQVYWPTPEGHAARSAYDSTAVPISRG